MLKRGWVCLSLTCALLACQGVKAAERPVAGTIRAAAAAARPAVVSIEVTRRQNAQNLLDPRGVPLPPIIQPPGGPQPPDDERRQRRWEFRWPPHGNQPQVIPFGPGGRFQVFGGRQTGDKGAGALIQVEGERGLVAAPQALVAGAQKVTVRLADGRKLEAKLLGTDRLTGTACLEVRGPKLPPIRPAKAQALQVGDWVLAVGGPESGGALTLGIVSAKGRPGTGDLAAARLILTDAFVPDTMAGAPLVNLRGEMVGMTLPQPQGWRRGGALTTALPIDTLQATVAELAARGKVARGWLGIQFQPLPAEVRQQLHIGHGVQVARVVEGQPAALGGIENGDVLLEFAGRKLTDAATFRALVGATKPGTRVAVKLLRGGQEMAVHVIMGEQEAEGGEPALPRGGEKLDIGLTLQPLTPELAAQFGFEGGKGLVVTAVEPGSPATKGRPNPVERGDLIKEVARKPVTTAAEAQQALKQAVAAKAKSVLLLVRSGQGTRYIVVDLAQ